MSHENTQNRYKKWRTILSHSPLQDCCLHTQHSPPPPNLFLLYVPFAATYDHSPQWRLPDYPHSTYSVAIGRRLNSKRFWRWYIPQSYSLLGLCPSAGFLKKSIEHKVSETGADPNLRRRGGGGPGAYWVGCVRRLPVMANVVPSSSICHRDDRGASFLRNVGSYKSHTA
jgi:hypothetical protein